MSYDIGFDIVQSNANMATTASLHTEASERAETARVHAPPLARFIDRSMPSGVRSCFFARAAPKSHGCSRLIW
jgi:hypothetical protein